VSENDNCYIAGRRYKSSGKESKEGTPVEESLEASSENRHRVCRRDMLRSHLIMHRANGLLSDYIGWTNGLSG